MNKEIMQTIAGGLLPSLLYIIFFVMFLRAVIKKELIFRGGIIRGRLARILGVIGLVGITAGVYVAIGMFVFHIEPPGSAVALFLFLLFAVMVITIRLLSIFFWRPKRKHNFFEEHEPKDYKSL